MNNLRKKKLNKLYESKFLNNKEEIKTLGWGSIETQKKKI